MQKNKRLEVRQRHSRESGVALRNESEISGIPETTRNDLLRRFTLRADPYRALLHRRNYYTLKRRLRPENVREVDLNTSPYWEPIDEGRSVLLYAINEWEVLEWFIRLVNAGDLRSLPASEMLAFQEDYQAFQARVVPVLTKGPSWNRKALPSMEELIALQKTMSDHVEAFLENGSFIFKDFTPTICIERHPDDRRRLVRHEFVPFTDARGMLYLFATLLWRVGLPIERCPFCRKIFLKSRKDAGYCSRDCQRLHYAQKKRGDRPPGKRGRPRKYPEPETLNTPPNSGAKKGAKHGT